MIRRSALLKPLLLVTLLFLMLVALSDRAAPAQAQSGSLTGTLLVRIGSPPPDADSQEPQRRFYILDEKGNATEISIPGKADLNAAITVFDGKQVTAQIVGASGAAPGGTGPIRVESVRAAGQPALLTGPDQSPQAAPPPAPLIGSKRWVTIPCRFADSTSTTPRTKGYIEGLMTKAFAPGMLDYWGKSSYGALNLSGGAVVDWKNLPLPRSSYVGLFNADLQKLFDDCTAAADAEVNFQNYDGINLLFNQDLDCCAWSGPMAAAKDGPSKTFMTTWLPAWAYANQEVVARHIGQAMGLPHSSGPYTSTFDSAWDVMSQGGLCQIPDSTYGCVAVDTISYHKDLLGWVPSNRKYVADPLSVQTITIDHLGAGDGANYLMAKVPIGGSTTHFYTVEVRRKIGYDVETPGGGVIIHEVDTTRVDRRAQVLDSDGNGNPNDVGAIWTVGETYQNDLYGVTIEVLAEDGNSFVLKITLGLGTSSPPNDDFNNAIGSNLLPLALVQNATLATTASDDPSVPCGDPLSPKNSNSLWYKYTPASTIPVQVSTQGSSYDTVVAVWTGARGSLTGVACNDDVSGSNQTSNLTFSAQGGVTYYIEVVDHGAPGGGTLRINISSSNGGLTGPAWWFPWYDNSGMLTKIYVGNATTDKTARCNIYIGEVNGNLALRGAYAMNPGEVIVHENAQLITGPVKVLCDQPVAPTEQAFYGTSFNEVSGIPESLIGTEWWFPWYDNQGMITWILIGNPSSTVAATCQVFIGRNSTTGALISRGQQVIQPGKRETPQYPNLITGPVKVVCDNPVYVTERSLFSTSFSEVLGIPPSAFNRVQWFPWYDQQGMHTWVHMGNPSSTQWVTCDVYVGLDSAGNPAKKGTYMIPPNGAAPPQFPGLIGGPVKVECDKPIYASERAIYKNSFNEVMAIPQSEFAGEWWFPWYDNVRMNMWLLLGNPSTTETATCGITIAGIFKGNVVVPPKGRETPQYSGVSDGPVRVACDKPVYSTERAIYRTSFSEMVGLQPQ